jgi:hypothetical protein
MTRRLHRLHLGGLHSYVRHCGFCFGTMQPKYLFFENDHADLTPAPTTLTAYLRTVIARCFQYGELKSAQYKRSDSTFCHFGTSIFGRNRVFIRCHFVDTIDSPTKLSSDLYLTIRQPFALVEIAKLSYRRNAKRSCKHVFWRPKSVFTLF